MAASIVDLEDGYFRALHEVIVETERALRAVSRINAHYVSQVVTVMSSWQEAVQTAASHMEGVDTTIYLARHEDAQKATREYVVNLGVREFGTDLEGGDLVRRTKTRD